jgi:RecA-family ATPase
MTKDIINSRLKLAQAGYCPLPCIGKQPVSKSWQQPCDVTNEVIEMWDKTWPDAINTGALTRDMPTLDLDIKNEEAARAAEALVRSSYDDGGRLLVRLGNPPKRAIPFRTDKPFKKISVSLIAPNGGADEKIEFLADGQQVVVAGIHPTTKAPYRWFGGDLKEINREELPHINERAARGLVGSVVDLLISDFGYSRAKERPKTKTTNGGGDAKPNGGGSGDWKFLIANIHSGHDLHDSLRDLAAKARTAGMAPGATVNLLRGLMRSSNAPRDDRWQERFEDIIRLVDGADKFRNGEAEDPPPPLPWIDMSNWDNEQIPQQEWAVLDRIPLRQVTLFSGEGGAGKSITTLYLATAHVLSRDWLGSMPEPGPAFFIDAEDDQRVLHHRLANVVCHFGSTFKDVIDNGLHVMSLAGQDSVLATVNRSGKIEATPIYMRLLEAAADIKPKMIGIASAANIFTGSENDRAQVQQFVNLLTRLAITADGSVVLISHPSLTGINTNSGLSGTTAWHSAVRARLYMKSIQPEAGEQPTTDLREIIFKKNNYGPVGDTIIVRWREGLFLPVPGMTSLDRAAHEHEADQLFLQLLDRYTQQCKYTSNKVQSNNYAPTVFAKEPEARRRFRKEDFEGAMRRLFAANKIVVKPHGSPSKGWTHLERV